MIFFNMKMLIYNALSGTKNELKLIRSIKYLLNIKHGEEKSLHKYKLTKINQ